MDQKSSPSHLAAKGCADCGNQVPSISSTIQGACTFLVQAHNGVSGMYRSLAAAAKDPKDAEQYAAAADKHARMAAESAQAVVPEEL